MSPAIHTSIAQLPTPLIHDAKTPDSYRNYEAETRDTVKQLYQLNHAQQTLAFVLAKKAEYTKKDKAEMGVWEAMDFLNQLVDDSDPDIELPQIDHALQTAEAIRQDGHPRWFVLTGLIHDLGKVLCLFDEPQWAVVGDTNPVGCAFSNKIVYPEFFNENPDSSNPKYNTPNGIYTAGCGLDNVHLSWGHDEYLYHVVKDYLPEEALAMIRYHSCYVVHQAGEYGQFLTERDHEMMKWVRAFNPYDLYSKVEVRPNFAELKPYYEELVAEYFPQKLRW